MAVKYGDVGTSMMSRLNEPEDESCRLKKMYAEERLTSELRKEALKSGEALSSARACEANN